MKMSFRILPVILFFILPITQLLAQETETKEADPYDDYSHLWEEDDKKRKIKRKTQIAR